MSIVVWLEPSTPSQAPRVMRGCTKIRLYKRDGVGFFLSRGVGQYERWAGLRARGGEGERLLLEPQRVRFNYFGHCQQELQMLVNV